MGIFRVSSYEPPAPLLLLLLVEALSRTNCFQSQTFTTPQIIRSRSHILGLRLDSMLFTNTLAPQTSVTGPCAIVQQPQTHRCMNKMKLSGACSARELSPG
jgi:hypothetical protein